MYFNFGTMVMYFQGLIVCSPSCVVDKAFNIANLIMERESPCSPVWALVLCIYLCILWHSCSNCCSFLHARLRTSTLRHDEEGQAVLINLLLRNYFHYNLYDQVIRSLVEILWHFNATKCSNVLFFVGGQARVQFNISQEC